MASPDCIVWNIDIATIAAGTGDERNFALPTGTWRLIAASVMPSTTSAASATNYSTLDLRNGDTNLCVTALTTATVALTKGTARAFTITELYSTFVGGTSYLQIVKTETGGAGAVLDGSFLVVFEKVHA